MTKIIKQYFLRKKITKQYLILLMCSWMSISYFYHTQNIENNDYMLKLNNIANNEKIITRHNTISNIFYCSNCVAINFTNFRTEEFSHREKKNFYFFLNLKEKNEIKFAIYFFIQEFNAMYIYKKGGDKNVSKYL